MTQPIVAIIGRQNVGKSTLLNRLAGKRIAITADLPGTTRDRILAPVLWQEQEFTLVDTGGLDMNPQSTIDLGVKEQVSTAVNDADAIIFLVNAQEGLNTIDHEISEMLRRSDKPVLLVSNKADNARLENESVDFFDLGLGQPMTISANHGRGTADLLDKIIDILPPIEPVETASDSIGVAIVGRPNVGKSMLVNSLLGEERSLVTDMPGTTRDAIDSKLDFQGESVLLIDTAGIRRRGRLGAGVEKYSALRAMRAIERADIALLVVDAGEPFTAQDLHIGGYIHQMAKGIILIVNKWDLIAETNLTEWNGYIRSQMKFTPYAPILYTSAKFNRGTDKILPQISRVYQERLKRLPTPAVNSIVRKAVASHNMPRKGAKRLKILYVTQADVNPPTFVFFVNDPTIVHFSYHRFLENKLRQAFGFEGTPLRLIFKKRSEDKREE